MPPTETLTNPVFSKDVWAVYRKTAIVLCLLSNQQAEAFDVANDLARDYCPTQLMWILTYIHHISPGVMPFHLLSCFTEQLNCAASDLPINYEAMVEAWLSHPYLKDT